METIIAKKSNEALTAGYAKAKYAALVSGLKLTQTGAAWLDVQHAADLRNIEIYEKEIAQRIAAKVEANRAFEMDAAKLEAAYYAEMARIAEVENAMIEALEMQWEEMVASGLAEQFYGLED
jgi:murein L,D-transpeptidase YcbB/YkuD